MLQRQPRRGRGRDGWGDWLPEPAVDRVAHGLPRQMVFNELFALGNAVVPQISEHIGRMILEATA
ncbi:hypothetical protein SEA_LATRETIUM_68 [Mycobacterium phage Latretium]|nr:hypothetical protein SEA_LATRETIUM_68 [Mycobacterium phage Latretium]